VKPVSAGEQRKIDKSEHFAYNSLLSKTAHETTAYLYGNMINFVITYGGIDEIVEMVDGDVAWYHWPMAIFYPKMDFYWWNRWPYWPIAKMLGGLEQPTTYQL
jgi:hypothetical protein